MKPILYIYVCLVFLSERKNVDFCDISKKIYTTQKHYQSIFKLPLFFHKARLQLLKNDNVKFLTKKITFLYLLEAYDVQTGENIGLVWNESGKVNYRYSSRGKELQILVGDSFSRTLQIEVEKGKTVKWESKQTTFGSLSGVATNVNVLEGNIILKQFEFVE